MSMKPDVKAYLNVYQYLQDHYQFRKNQNSQFSYELWAKELGVNDKSYLRLMVIGKRNINDSILDSFLKNLELSKVDQEYFAHLVQYTQSKTRGHKELFGKKLISILKSDLDQIEIQAHYDFVSNPVLPRLQVLFSFDDLDQSVDNLSQLLNVSTQDIKVGIDKLVELQLIKYDGHKYQPIKKSFKVKNGFGDIGLEAFYTHNLKIAKEAIALPKEQRHFKSLFLPLNKDEYDQYLTNLQNFTNEQLYKFNPNKIEDRRLYQVHFNIIPVSEQVDTENKDKYNNRSTQQSPEPEA